MRPKTEQNPILNRPNRQLTVAKVAVEYEAVKVYCLRTSGASYPLATSDSFPEPPPSKAREYSRIVVEHTVLAI